MEKAPIINSSVRWCPYCGDVRLEGIAYGERLHQRDADHTHYSAIIDKAISLCKRLLEIAEHGDYSNGNEAFGLDEGRVRTNELINQCRKELQALLKEAGEDNG